MRRSSMQRDVCQGPVPDIFFMKGGKFTATLSILAPIATMITTEAGNTVSSLQSSRNKVFKAHCTAQRYLRKPLPVKESLIDDIFVSAGRMASTNEELGRQAQVQRTVASDASEGGAGPSSVPKPVLALRNRDPNGTSPPFGQEGAPQPDTTSRTGVTQHSTSSAVQPPLPTPTPAIPRRRRSSGEGSPSATRLEASNNIPLQPLRRDSQASGHTPKQSQATPSSGPVHYQPGVPVQPNAGVPQPPVQPFSSNPPVIPTGWQRGYPYSFPPDNAFSPYQRILPGTPQMYASPAPLSTYVPSPAPQPTTMWNQSPAMYPSGSTNATPNRPHTIAASPAYLPGSQPVPQPSTRPLTNASSATPRYAYGDPATTNVPQGTPAQPQSAPTPSMQPPQPATPGAPVIPNSVPLPAQYPTRAPTRRATDVFVANDPFKASSHGRHSKRDDDVTFDDIPVAGQPGSNPVSTTPYWPPPASVPYNGTPSWGMTPNWQQSAPRPTAPQPDQPFIPPINVGQPVAQPPVIPGETHLPQETRPVHSPTSPESRPPTPAESTESPGPQSPTQPAGPPQPERHDTLDSVIPVSPERESQSGENEGQGPGETNAPNGPERPASPEGRHSAHGSFESYNPYRPSSPFIRGVEWVPAPSPYSPYGYVDPAFLQLPYNQPYYVPPPQKQTFWSKLESWLSPSRRSETYKPPNPYAPYGPPPVSEESEKGPAQLALTFIIGTLPSQIYLHFLLRLPSLYFSRVARIFEEADLTLPEIKKMALQTASQGKADLLEFRLFEVQNVPPQYERLKSTWEAFIDSVMREWKTYNIISVLLLSAILTILQIDSAASDPLTRYTALFSLICALMSLLFGCMYIIRFGTMRKTYKAAEWALEAKRTKTIWWNVWVLLAMPAIWLTWSIVLYIACIMSFIWRTTPSDQGPNASASNRTILVLRIVISTVLGLGVVYGWLVLSTFRRYGTAMDKAWKKRIDGWIEEKAQQQSTPYPYSTPYYNPTPYPYPGATPYASYTYIPQPGAPVPPYSEPNRTYPPDPKGGYGFSDPTYATASYVPPAEVYDSSESLEENNGTDDSTQRNTYYNAFPLGFHPYGRSNEPHDQPGPRSHSKHRPSSQVQPPASDDPSSQFGLKRAPLAVPPPPTLPPIPGTPATAFLRSAPSSLGSTADQRADPTGYPDVDDDVQNNRPENHVHFLSPLFSPRTSFFGSSTGDGTELPETGSIQPDSAGGTQGKHPAAGPSHFEGGSNSSESSLG